MVSIRSDFTCAPARADIDIDLVEIEIAKMRSHLGANADQMVRDFYLANNIRAGEALSERQALALSGQLSGEMACCACIHCLMD